MKKSAFLLIISLLFQSCQKEIDKTLPKETSITESVYASATVQPDSLYQVYSSVNGIVDYIYIVEGDLVQKNQPLFKLINNSPELNAENAKLSYQLAKENYQGSNTLLNTIRKEIQAAELRYNNDSVSFSRQKNLWDQKIGSKAEYDQKKLSYELSSNNLKLLQSKYAQAKNELSTQLKQAENNLKTSQIASADFIIGSKINGKVYAVNKEQGEVVTTQQPLATIGSSSVYIIELLIDEVDIVKLTANQLVLLSLDAYPNEIFTAKISKIYPQKDERNQTFKVEALFEKRPKVVYPGMSGEANIHISFKKKTLVIPKEYIKGINQVKTDKGWVTIETGLQTLDSVEVISGITAKTWIYKEKND